MRSGGLHRRIPRWLTSGFATGVLTGAIVCVLPGAVAFAQSSVAVDGVFASSAAPAAESAFGTSPLGSIVRVDTNQPLNLEGDELIYDSSGQRVTARGNVEILFNNYVLKADEVIYDQQAGTLTAIGNVSLREPRGAITRGERITLTDDFRDGFVEALSVTTADSTRITARRAIRRDGNVSVFEDGKFTPCRTDQGTPPLWCISAARVVHDQTAATITYENAAFEFFGVPVLVLPFFQHADPSVKRKSGFLQPSYRHSNQLGYMVETPYYFALSPNYDFTFNPAFMTQQGVLFQGTWRQKLAFGSVRGQYDIELAGIDQRLEGVPEATRAFTESDRRDLEGFRGSLKTRGDFSLSSWWKFGWNATIESDDSFRRFYKLDSVLTRDRINTTYLIGLSDRNYFSIQGYYFGGLGPSESLTAESVVHPVVDWNYLFANPVFGGELGLNLNAVSLSRDVDKPDDEFRSNYSRASVELNWRRKLTDYVGITYTPFANLRGDVISLNDTFSGDAAFQRDVGNFTLNDDEREDGSFARGTAAAGVLAEYPWLARTERGSHVISPIGQLIARSRLGDDQGRLPNEDARSLVFDDTNLFEVDKFSGYDRIETGSRANVGIQYTFQADAGGHGRILLGQSFRLDDENAFARSGRTPINFVNPTTVRTESSFAEDSGLETRRSDYVVGAYIAPSRHFQLVAQTRFDDETLDVRQADVFGRVDYGPVYLSAAYSFTSNDYARENSITACRDNPARCEDQQEILASGGLRLSDFWTLTAGVRYDIDASDFLQQSIGLKYADDCFVLAVTYTESGIDDPDNGIEADQIIMVRFDLKHLGQFQTQSSISDLLPSENEQ